MYQFLRTDKSRAKLIQANRCVPFLPLLTMKNYYNFYETLWNCSSHTCLPPCKISKWLNEQVKWDHQTKNHTIPTYFRVLFPVETYLDFYIMVDHEDFNFFPWNFQDFLLSYISLTTQNLGRIRDVWKLDLVTSAPPTITSSKQCCLSKFFDINVDYESI